MEAGWMLVVLVVAGLAYRRVGRDQAHEKRLQQLEEKFSAWPHPDEVLERLDELEADLEKLQASGATLPAIIARANDITKDMLALKTVVSEHREMLALLRSKGSLRALAGDPG